MARFAYQPILEENEKFSKPGQLIINRYNAHLSVNKNNLIISITKEIEDKIFDILELKSEIDEQYDVILNLIEDFWNFINNDFKNVTEIQNKTFEYDKKLLNISRYISTINNGTNEKLDDINNSIIKLKKANSFQKEKNNLFEKQLSEILPEIDCNSYIQKEYSTLLVLKENYS